jgi:hypothetical protein
VFSDKDRKAWQNIHAPKELLSEIENRLESPSNEQRTVFKYGVKRFALPLIAASLLLIFSTVMILGKKGNVAVYADGTHITNNAVTLEMPISPMHLRTVLPIESVELSLDIDKPTQIIAEDTEFEVISHDSQVLFSGDSYTADGSISLIWKYPLPETTQEYKLVLVNDFSEYEIILVHDTQAVTRTLSCVRK